MSASANLQNKKIVEVVALALQDSRSSQFLLARRGPEGSGAGEWEFPGGKIEPGETQQQALVREISEELNYALDLNNLSFVGESLHSYPNKTVRIFLWQSWSEGKPQFQLVDHDQTQWFELSDIVKINLSHGDKPFISLLESYSKK